MKFTVGYQLFSDTNYIDEIIKRKQFIEEVYFAWGDIPNGRNSLVDLANLFPWDAQAKQIADLDAITQAGISVNLLLNATCYGKDSQSRRFFEKIGDTVDYLSNRYMLSSVTTTSPLIAGFIHSNFPQIDVRASVNMGIGTVEGMDYVRDCFDSFYLKRELNRNFTAIRTLKAWCDDNGKKLYALANSGCLNYCSAHTFHDNLVSHEQEIGGMDNAFAFEGVCRKYLTKEENLHALLDYTGFIRPEDVHLFEGLFPAMKLATRVSADPVRILQAYIDRKQHIGSTLDLLEPNHTGTIYPYFLENSDIKATIMNDCLTYSNMEKALIKLEEDVYVNQ